MIPHQVTSSAKIDLLMRRCGVTLHVYYQHEKNAPADQSRTPTEYHVSVPALGTRRTKKPCSFSTVLTTNHKSWRDYLSGSSSPHTGRA